MKTYSTLLKGLKETVESMGNLPKGQGKPKGQDHAKNQGQPAEPKERAPGTNKPEPFNKKFEKEKRFVRAIQTLHSIITSGNSDEPSSDSSDDDLGTSLEGNIGDSEEDPPQA